MKSYGHQIETWIAFAKEKGLPKQFQVSPLDRLCWFVGLEFSPVALWRLRSVFLFTSVESAVFWGTWMYCWGKFFELNYQLPRLAICSAGFGLSMAAGFVIMLARTRRKHSLPTWEDFLRSQN